MEPMWRGGCGAVAGMVGQALTYPMDIVRARLTLGEGGGIVGTARNIIAESGPRGLYIAHWVALPTCNPLPFPIETPVRGCSRLTVALSLLGTAVLRRHSTPSVPSLAFSSQQWT